MNKYQGHCTGGKLQAIHPIVEAINVPQAKKFLEARYPGYKQYYTSHRI